MFEWPKSSCTERRSAPFIRRSVAKLCLSSCAWTCLGMPASRARVEIRRWTERGVILPMTCPDLSMLIKRAFSVSLRFARYLCIAFFAESAIKTTRSLSPFPRTETSPRRRSIVRSSAHSSESLRPVEKNVSSIALSRNARGPSPFATASKRSRSLYSRISICRDGFFGSSIFSAASVFMSCLARYLRKFLIAMT